MTRKNGQTVNGDQEDDLGVKGSLQDEAARQKWPHIFRLLDPRYSKGKITYEGGTLKVIPTGGFYKVSIHCPTASCELTGFVVSLTTVFEELEDLLKNGRLSPLPDYDGRKRTRQRWQD